MGLRADEILSSGRRAPLVRARFAIWWVARRIRPVSLQGLGRAMGGLDHSSVSHGIHRAGELRDRDPAFRSLTDRMLEAFRDGDIDG